MTSTVQLSLGGLHFNTVDPWQHHAGKTSIARTLAALAEQELTELALTVGTDISDLLGGFEQLEPQRRIQVIPALHFYLVGQGTALCKVTQSTKQGQ